MDRKTRQMYLSLKRSAKRKADEYDRLQNQYSGVRPSSVSADLAMIGQDRHNYEMAAENLLEGSSWVGNPLAQISTWLQDAFPEPKEKNVHTQMGVHFEEVHEMLQPLIESEPIEDGPLLRSSAKLDELQRALKTGNIQLDLDKLDRESLLDALCDQIVTAIGVAHMLGMDIQGALQEVADSNDSKFDDQGLPIFDENLKLVKGPSYFKADLKPYIKGDDS